MQYDQEYYSTHLGPIPCEPGNPVWEGHFFNMANNIALLRPRSVIDIGCAFGMLVRNLQILGMFAVGIDISPYAIRKAVTHNVKRANIVDWQPRWKFDLAVSIEVFEHIDPRYSDIALKNMCMCADDILFSSSPDDTVEETHVNVHSLSYWDKAFADLGFKHDSSYDASYITPQARKYHRAQ